jgi:hypothetical protein
MGSRWARLVAEGGERLGPFAAAKGFFRSGRHLRVGADDVEGAVLRDGANATGSDFLLRLRPTGAAGIPGGVFPVSAEDAALMRASHSEVTAILDAALGRPLTQDEIARLVRHVNPTGRGGNCFEGSLGLDEILGGRAVVAGPSVTVHKDFASALVHKRSLYRLPGLRADQVRIVEAQLTSFGAGARGIIMRWGDADEGVPSHVYNVANVGGKIQYLEGQVGKVFDEHPARGWFSTYDFYRTA